LHRKFSPNCECPGFFPAVHSFPPTVFIQSERSRQSGEGEKLELFSVLPKSGLLEEFAITPVSKTLIEESLNDMAVMDG